MILTDHQRELYNNLLSLVQSNEAFYHQDFNLDESVYRIFNYRLASYTDFLQPGALECRGIMFEIDTNENPIRLASRPMQKFFNMYENPITMDVDLNDIDSISTKADGSLISTYIHADDVRLKSKGSLFSDQAIESEKWLNNNARLKTALRAITMDGYTVNLEWVSPFNRIVLGYERPQLIVLNVRHRVTGQYLPIGPDHYLYQFMDPPVDLCGKSPIQFVHDIPDMMDDIEGFVVKMKTGLWMKIKTKKYLSLHHCKDSVNNPRRLFEVILNEGIDDVRSMFHTDKVLINQIDNMQTTVDHLYNHLVNEVETFYDHNKHLERKEYAIKAHSEVTKLYFSLVMMKYLNTPIDYKKFMISKWRQLGIKDMVNIKDRDDD